MDVVMAPETKQISIPLMAHFFQLRALAFRDLQRGNHENALKQLIRAIAVIETISPPPIQYDPSLEHCLIEIANHLKNTLPPTTPIRNCDSKIKVGHISPVFMDGGGHTWGFLGFLAASQGSARFDVRGYSLEYLAMGDAPPEFSSYSECYASEAMARIKQYSLPVYFFPRNLSLLDKVLALRNKLIEDQIEIVLLHAITWDAVSVIASLLLPQCRFIYLHVADARLNIAPFLLEYHVDMLSAPCEKLVIERKPKFLTIPSMCDFRVIESFAIQPYSKEELCLKSTDLVAGTFGAQHKIYTPGNEVFLIFLKKLLEKIPNLHYFFLGPGTPLFDLPKVLLTFLGPELNARVHPLGMHRDSLKILKSLDLYIDSFPIGGGGTIFQAMASGLPILMLKTQKTMLTFSDSMRTREAIMNSPEELLQSAIHLLENPNARVKLSNALLEEFNEWMHPNKIIQNYETFFESLHNESVAFS